MAMRDNCKVLESKKKDFYIIIFYIVRVQRDSIDGILLPMLWLQPQEVINPTMSFFLSTIDI